MNVWRLITHHADRDAALFWARQNSRIAIGWGAIGDIRERGYGSADDITSAIRTQYPYLGNSHLGGVSLWDFYAQMQNGDLVILSANKPRILIVEVEGDYQHQRRVIVRRDLSPEDVWKKAGAAARQNVHQTLIRCERTLTEDDL